MDGVLHGAHGPLGIALVVVVIGMRIAIRGRRGGFGRGRRGPFF
jgi:hypothetical protein